MTSKNTYRLINPYIEGTFDPMVKAKNSRSAGIKLYNSASNYFTNHLEDFYMTLQNVETKNLSHFRINERKNNDEIVFDLYPLSENFPPELEKKLIESVDKLYKQRGGKKHSLSFDLDSDFDDFDDSDDSDDSDEYDEYGYPSQPICRFTYFHLPYQRLNLIGLTPMDVNRLFMPVFSSPINPIFEIRFDIYKYWI